MHKQVAIIITLFMSFICHNAMAHSEHDKARFVSTQGKDTGDCNNVLRPCQTISYAVNQANKGDKVLISSGRYNISSSDELFYLKSEIVPVQGGYNRFDHFQSQSPNSNITTLTGIPMEMADDLRSRGFSVLADGKSFIKNKDLQRKLSAYNQLSKKQANLACENGKAGNFPCKNIDLLAHMPLSSFSTKPNAANDIWGHTDLNNQNEYAIIGVTDGIAVVNVTDPSNPVEVGTINGKNTSWRDIKVYQYFDDKLNLWRAYAYATIDSASDNITVIDLNHLPNAISLVEKNKAVQQAHNVYISNVDHTLNTALPGMTPTLQIIGSNEAYSGAFHSYSLTNPEKIVALDKASAGEGYTHDGASITITDDRKNSDCQSKGSSCTVFIDFNENEMKLWNISDPNKSSMLGKVTYANVAYTHSGWASEDQKYIFLHDELDESRHNLNTTVRVFSIDNLKTPTQVATWSGPTKAIDHNGFVRGNRYYMSNYERGLTVLDISDAKNPKEIGFFDTYTPSDSNNFNGAWGTYPFLPSGNILISDIGSGLYIVKDNTQTSPQGVVSFTNKTLNAEQGKALQVSVQRTGAVSSATNVSIAYEILPGSAKENIDYTPISGQLTWIKNNTDNQTFTIPIAADPTGEEHQEIFFVRLYNPTNGATLSSPSYLKVNVDGKPDPGAISFTQKETTVPENQTTATINIARDGNNQGEVSVNYRLKSGTAEISKDIEESSGTLTWQDGNSDNKTITLKLINDDIEEGNENVFLELEATDGTKLGANSSIKITITDDDTNTAPVVKLGENRQVNTGQTVTLKATATDAENDSLTYSWSQKSGTSVTLKSTNEASTTFVAPSSAATLEFIATVTDSKGAKTDSSVKITVVEPPKPTPTPPPTAKKSSGGGSMGASLIALALLVRLRKAK